MTEILHSRAQRLFAQSPVEAISPADSAWLDQHLRSCPDCAREILDTQELLGALRRVPIVMPRDLAARTQLRVRLRAQESAQTSHSSMLLWLITADGAGCSASSAHHSSGGPLLGSVRNSACQITYGNRIRSLVDVPPLLAAGVILHQKALAAEWSNKK